MRQQTPAIARVGQLASAIALLLAGTTVANAQQPAQQQAQQQPAADQTQDRTLEDEITVTGSRIRRDDFSSPQPTTVMDSEYLQNLGVINLGQAMVGVPQNVNRNSPDANAGNNFFNGSTLANLRGLNPFFGTRTLTLVDSRRHVPTNQGDGVDLNFIPTILIDRVETVTGGASASYGSGAIGGGQNILLDRDYEGIKAEVDYGTTGEGDGESTHYGVAWGTGFGETGQFVVGIEGEDSEGIFKCASARDWCGTNTGTITNWTFATPGYNGLPQNIITGNVREAWNSRNGIFWLPNIGGRVSNSGTVVPGVQLNSAGNGLQNFDPGVGGDGFFAAQAIGGEGEGIYNDLVLRSPVDRTIGYLSFTTDFTEQLGFFVEASGGTTETSTEGGFTNVSYTCIRPDNAYVQLNPTLAAFVTANANPFFPCPALVPGVGGYPASAPAIAAGVPFHKNWENQIDHGNDTSTDLSRVAFGFDGEFGDSSWTWDAYYQWGKSEREQKVRDLVHENMYNYAMDTVLVGGVPTCRSVANPNVLTPAASSNATNLLGRLVANPELRIGCQPLNPFGQGPISAGAKGYAFGFIRENTDVEQNMAEFVASGDIAEGFGAGSLKAAAGVSFRSEELSNIAAEELGDAVRRDFAIQYGESFAGDVDVLELFTEFDLPFHERFSMNVAGRHSEYTNTAGFGTPDPGAEYKYNIDTWKVGAQIDVVPALSIRLSQSRDIRAPNQRELYYGQVFTPGSFFGFIQPPFSNNPWTNTTAPDPVSSTLFGGARNGVLPEEADTTTIGFVIQPPDIGLRMALDYFDITLENSISPANLSITIQGCYAGIASYCDKITEGVQTPWQNPSLDHNGNPTPGAGPKDSIPCPAKCFIDIENYYSETFNAGEYDIKGLDFTLDWFKQLDNGSFMVRFLGTRTFEQNVNIIRTPFATLPPTNIVGAVGTPVGFLSDYASAADFTGSLTTTWQRGNFSLTGNMRYVDDGVNDRTRVGADQPLYNAAAVGSVTYNTVGSYEVYSTTAMYDFSLNGGNMLQLWGTINNLTDEDPPMLGGATGGTNAIFYSTAGREYRVGLRLGF